MPADGEDQERIRVLERRLARERATRAEAEEISERATGELYRTVQELTRSTWIAELLTDVAAHANEAASVEDAVSRVLASICSYTEWPVGHMLVRSKEDPSRLLSGELWSLRDPLRFDSFRKATEALSFPQGTGMPGRVVETGVPVWMADLAQEPTFQRRAAALSCGLHAAFGIPVLIKSETVAVLEFFATQIEPPDERMLRALTFIGSQIARVMEREAAEEKLRQQALYDGLTGLPNRTLLMERLRANLTVGARSGTTVDVLYLDIDDFKTINDSQGHRAGDEVLAAVASRLLEAVRLRSPTAPEPLDSLDTVARLGGDEFAIVLGDCADPSLVALRIEQRLKEALRLSSNEVFVSLSIGTSRARPDTSPEELLAEANVAMHEAKRAGKGQHVAFEPRMQERARRRHSLGEELHRAIMNEEFFLTYQAVVDLASGRVAGAEALVRWAHPSGRVVSPDDFIPRAEETGLILPLGAWVLRTACKQAAQWRQRHPAFAVAVNVSGRQLREPGFTDLVRMVLADYRLPAGALCLEMTESILMERDVHGIAMLNELRADGVHLAIDDFGTGYSSLSALRRLPVDLIKIDRSFVGSLLEDEDAGTIAWAVISLGHTMGIPVLAEGVETEAQRDALRGFGCDQAQGFLFSRPLPAEEFGRFLDDEVRPT